MQHRSQVATAASRIESYIQDNRLRKLPPMRALACIFGLSHGVTLSALGLLRERKVIDFMRGSAVRVVAGDSLPAIPAPEGAADRVAQRIIARIEEGQYISGQQLPKVKFISAGEGVTQRTVCRAYRLLCDQGLIHRRGKGFFAGPHGSLASAKGPSSHDRALIILHHSEATLRRSLDSSWTADFTHALMREMAFHQVKPIVVMLAPKKNANPYGIISGRDALMQTVRRLGDALAGIVVMFDYAEARATGDDIFELLRSLCAAGAKVAWLDRYDSCRPEEVWQGPAIYRGLIAQKGISKRLFRCHMAEMRSVRTTFSALYQAGHRVIGVPNTGKNPPWLRHRLAHLALGAREAGGGLRVVVQSECAPLFEMTGRTTGSELALRMDTARFPFLAFARAIALQRENAHAPFARMSREVRHLLLVTDRLGAMITQHNPTALIAPDDQRAHDCYRWLLAAEIPVPARMSLVSFDDNLDKLYPYPISSVNFGFDYLGYACFLSFLVYRTVRMDRWNSIGAQPRINHTGTIGPARAL